MSSPHHPFDRYVDRPTDEIRVAEAALLFSLDEYPHVDLKVYLDYLAHLSRQARRSGATRPDDQVDALRRILVEREGFGGALQEEHGPHDSYLNRVIDRRRGLPIALAVIWLDVAWTLKWPVAGIGMPGHFLLRHPGQEEGLYIDPFFAGASRTREECLEMARRFVGDAIDAHPDPLAPVDARRTLRRMLGNLYSHYLSTSDAARAARCLRRMIAVVPDEIPIQVERARLLTLMGEFETAYDALEIARGRAGDEAERDAVRRGFDDLRRRVAESN